MNKKKFDANQLDSYEGVKEFKAGQLVLYEGTFGFEIGKIKKLKGNRMAYVWFHSGDTAALTSFTFLTPIVNDYCIQDIINKEVE